MTTETPVLMSVREFENKMHFMELDNEFADYITNHTNARIGNGDMLIEAMESGDYYDSFKEHMTGVGP